MNYIELINNFWEKYHKTDSLNTTSIALYFHLVDICNEARWTNPFKRRSDKIEADLKMTRNTLVKARKSLSECGLISYATYNGVANVEYTLSNIDKVVEKDHQNMTGYEETLSKNDEVQVESLSKFDKVDETLSESLSETLSKNDTLNINSKHINNNKEKDKKKEDSKPYQNLTRSLIPTKNEVIDFFMSLKDLKPSEAESRAESFFKHFSEKNWRDGKSIIFDWMKAAQEWTGELEDKLKAKPKKKEKPILEYPYSSKEFLEKWETLANTPKWKNKEPRLLQAALDKMKEFDEEFSIEIMDRAIIGNYQGLIFANTTKEYQNRKKDEQRIIKISESGTNTNRTTTSDKRASRDTLEELADRVLEQYKTSES